MGFTELENVTGTMQTVYDEKGEGFSLPPFSSKVVKDEIAALFQAQRAAQVRRTIDGGVPPLLMGERPIWLANMTGSPFVPKEYTVSVMEKNVMVPKTFPNPNARAQKLQWVIHVGQGKDPYGRIVGPFAEGDFNLPPVQVSIRIRQRVVVGHPIGQSILQRDALEGEYGSLQVIECRPPSAFEPTMQWDLDKIIFFSRMVDGAGFDLETIINSFRIHCRDKNRRGVPELAEVMQDPAWNEAVKEDLLARLWYRIVDLNYAIPTEIAFDKHFTEAKEASAKKMKARELAPKVASDDIGSKGEQDANQETVSDGSTV
jgi:hypothetical protein